MEYNKNNYIFSLDIGTRSIVGVVGVLENDKIKIIDMESKFHQERAMFDGQIHDIEKVYNTVKIVKDNLESRLNTKLREVSIAAAGRSLKTINSTKHIELGSEIEIDENLVDSLEVEILNYSKRKLKKELDDDFKYYCVGSTVIKYLLDDRYIKNLIDQRGRKIGAQMISTFLPEIVVNSLYSVMNKAGLKVQHLTLEPIAAIEATVPENIRLLNIAIVDIGAGTSDIAITKDGSVIAYAMTDLAGDEITEELSRTYLLSFDESERLKCNIKENEPFKVVNILGKEILIEYKDYIKKIENAVNIISDKITKEILNKNKKSPSAVFLIGGGSLTPGIDKIIEKKLDLPEDRVAVRGADIIEKILIDKEKVKGPEWITPIGILLKGLNYKNRGFINITLNNKEISVFNKKDIKIIDALVAGNIDPKKLIPKKINDIKVIINGKSEVFKRGFTEPSKVFLNGIERNIGFNIKSGDKIEILEDNNLNSINLKDIINFNEYISLNGKETLLYHNILINNKRINNLDINTPIFSGYKIEFNEIKTLKELIDYNELEFEEIKVNGTIITDFENMNLKPFDEIIINNEIDENKKKNENIEYLEEKNEVKEKEESHNIHVLFNEKVVKIPIYDKEIIFVDIFKYVDFDRKNAKGRLIMELNGKRANYLDRLNDKDSIKVYWRR